MYFPNHINTLDMDFLNLQVCNMCEKKSKNDSTIASGIL